MLSLPDKYKKDNRIPLKPFLAALTPAERTRFKDSVEEIRITYQIEGFDIPNLVNDEYNCQVIAFLLITLKSLKSAAFVGRIVHNQVKTLCVIEFTDGTDECFCFADKRLNKQDKSEIVVEDFYITGNMPLGFSNDTKTLFSLYIDYETIINRSNKHAFYIEMMTKAYLIFNQALYSDCSELLDSKLWHNEDNAISCFKLLAELKQAKLAAAKATTVADKGKINKQIKAIITDLEKINER